MPGSAEPQAVAADGPDVTAAPTGPATLAARLDRLLRWVVPLAAFAYWLAYPVNPVPADEGVILHGAQRIVDGDVIYRDFFEFITPGSFYFFAALFAVVGPSLRAARYTMAVVHLVSATLLYRLTRRGAGPAEATLVVFLFATVCVPVWRIASPHWLSTCLCLSVASALLAERWSDRTRAIVAGLLAGVVFCVQQQRGTLIVTWVAATITLQAWLVPHGERWRWWVRQAGRATAAWLVVVTATLGNAAWGAGPGQLFYCLVTFVFDNYRRTFVGTVHWAASFFGVARLAPTWPWLIKWLPWVLVVEAALLAWRLRTRRGPEETTRAAILLLGAAMAAAILYFPDFVHVSFIAPFLLVIAARIVHELWCEQPFARWRVSRGLAAVAFVVALAAIVDKGRSNLEINRDAVPERIDSEMGPLDVSPEQRKVIRALRDAVLNGGDTIFSYPFDAWLYLATGAKNPTKYALMLRGYNSEAQYTDAIQALEANRTPYVVFSLMVKPDDPVWKYVEARYDEIARPGFYRLYKRVPGR
jgi:hypothetical protein